MSNFSDFYGGGGKSVQRGVATPTSIDELSVTVTAVNPARAMLNLLSASSRGSEGLAAKNTYVSLRIVNSTTIGIKSYSESSGSAVYLPCSWELIEFA